MLIIIDNLGNVVQYCTNSAFPDGNVPYIPELPEGQKYVRLHDNSEEAKQIMSAFDYTIDADKKVTVIKTKQQWKDEQPIEPKKQTLEERIEALEKEFAKLKAGET